MHADLLLNFVTAYETGLQQSKKAAAIYPHSIIICISIQLSLPCPISPCNARASVDASYVPDPLSCQVFHQFVLLQHIVSPVPDHLLCPAAAMTASKFHVSCPYIIECRCSDVLLFHAAVLHPLSTVHIVSSGFAPGLSALQQAALQICHGKPLRS